MTNLGAPDRPLRFWGEELQLDVFDGADPTDTGTYRWWFRSDLSVNESDAVIRVNDNGTIVDVPVFEESTPVEDGIETTFGVVGPGLAEPAFVPMTQPADAAFDFARVETPSGQELAMHDRLEPGSATPDSDVYLHDDWGDNKLQDREDSGTTTYNGETGVYRPEWTIDQSNPQAVNKKLEIDEDDALRTAINLNLNETITWEWTNVDATSSSGSGAGQQMRFGCFSERSARMSNNIAYEHSYTVLVRNSGSGNWIFMREDTGTSSNTLIEGPLTDTGDIKVTRDSNGVWEFFVDGVSQGTETDTTYTDPVYIGFTARDDDRDLHAIIDEMKVF